MKGRGKKAFKQFAKVRLAGKLAEKQQQAHASETLKGAKAGKNKSETAGKPVSKKPKASDGPDWTDVEFDDFLAHGFEQALANEEGSEAEVDGGSDDESPVDGAGPEAEEGEAEEAPAPAIKPSKRASVKPSRTAEAEEGADEAEPTADEVARHKKQLEILRQRDPEFAKMLESEEPDLLEFGEEEEEDGEAADQDEEAEGQAGQGKLLTAPLLKSLIAAAETSHTALKRLALAFRSACHVLDDGAPQGENHFKIVDSAVYNDLMVFCVTKFSTVLDKQMGRYDSNKPPNFSSGKWKKLSVIVKSYLSNFIHFVGQLTDSKMKTFVLHHSMRLLPYFGPFPKVAVKYLKQLLLLWGSAEEGPRLLAFLSIREMALALPHPMLDLVLKHAYLAFVRTSNFTNAKTMGNVNFMMNGVVELYALDFAVGYQHAFVYIRELAVALRKALQQKTKEAFRKVCVDALPVTEPRQVYNWQYMNSLRVFSKLLCDHPTQPDLALLFYPLIQILFGVASLVPTAAYFPLRFLALRLVNELSAASGLLASPLPYLLEVLDSRQFSRKPANKQAFKDSHPIDLVTVLKVPKGYLRSKDYQEGIFAQVLQLLYQHFANLAYSIAFPELIIPVQVFLTRWIKNSRAQSFNRQLTTMLEKLEAQASWVLKHRSKLDYSPSDLEQANSFLSAEKAGRKAPLDVFYRDFARRQEELRSATVFRSEDGSERPQAEGTSDDESGDDDGSSDAQGSAADSDQEENGEQEGAKEDSAFGKQDKAKRKRLEGRATDTWQQAAADAGDQKQSKKAKGQPAAQPAAGNKKKPMTPEQLAEQAAKRKAKRLAAPRSIDPNQILQDREDLLEDFVLSDDE